MDGCFVCLKSLNMRISSDKLKDCGTVGYTKQENWRKKCFLFIYCNKKKSYCSYTYTYLLVLNIFVSMFKSSISHRGICSRIFPVGREIVLRWDSELISVLLKLLTAERSKNILFYLAAQTPLWLLRGRRFPPHTLSPGSLIWNNPH